MGTWQTEARKKDIIITLSVQRKTSAATPHPLNRMWSHKVNTNRMNKIHPNEHNKKCKYESHEMRQMHAVALPSRNVICIYSNTTPFSCDSTGLPIASHNTLFSRARAMHQIVRGPSVFSLALFSRRKCGCVGSAIFCLPAWPERNPQRIKNSPLNPSLGRVSCVPYRVICALFAIVFVYLTPSTHLDAAQTR